MQTGISMLTTNDSDVHILADGQRLDSHTSKPGVYTFRVPAGTKVLRLVSRANRPVDLGINTDTRSLGFCIYKLNSRSETGAFNFEIMPDNIALAQGYHPAAKGTKQRWTTGDAALPNVLVGPANENIVLEVFGKGLAQYIINDLRPSIKTRSDIASVTSSTERNPIAAKDADSKTLVSANLDKLDSLHEWPEYPVYISDRLNIKSIVDMTITIEGMLASISDMKLDAIVGLPRSGLFAANLIALRLNLPLITTNELIHLGFDLHGKRVSREAYSTDFKRVLVIDDFFNNKQNNLEQVKKDLKCLDNRFAVKYGVIYIIKPLIDSVDVYGEVLSFPQVFEWNLFHHLHIKDFLFEMDGVLCEDGLIEDDLNIDAYASHLITRRQKYIPSHEIGAIVTNRLEKYRGLTEAWLLKHNVRYKKLIMCNLNSAKERRGLNLHAAFKAHAYRLYGGRLFIESELWQAREIVRISGKPVFCTENMQLIDVV